MIDLQAISLKSFLTYEDSNFDLGNKITAFTGLNNVGKSSIKDGIEFALTGKARNVTKFKDAGLLARDGVERKMAVILDYKMDDETMIVERKVDNASANILDNELIHYVLNPMDFIRLSQKERGRIFADTLKVDNVRELIRALVSEHIGKFPDKVVTDVKKTGISLFDIDALQKVITDCRRAYKRLLKEAESSCPKITDYNLPEDFDKIENAKACCKLEDMFWIDVNLLKESATIDPDKLKQQINDIDIKIKECADGKEKPIRGMDAITGKVINNARQQLELLEQARGDKKCPTCEMPGDDAHFAAVMQKISEWLESQSVAESKMKKILHRNETLDDKIELLNREKIALTSLHTKAVAAKNEGKPTDLKKLREIQDEVSQLQKNHLLYETYENAVTNYETRLESSAGLDDLIEFCNKADKALEDGGPIKTAISNAGKTLPISEEMLTTWGVEQISVNTNGQILYNDRDIAAASTSEKYRIAGIVSMALSQAGDIGFAALDDFEILVGSNWDAIEQLKNVEMNNILIFESTSKAAKVYTERGVQCVKLS